MAEYTIDKIEYGDNVYNLSPNVVYATCSTAASTAAKVATITSGTLNSLNTGDQVIVKFTYANGKASPTLKVGSTDAKSIMRYGTTAPSTSAATSWNAGSCVWFVYDGTYWQMAGWINSTYTVTDKKLEIGAVTSGTTYYPIVGTGTTAATRQYDSTGFEYGVFTGTTETQGGAGIRLGNSTATGTDGNKKGFITIYGTGSNSSTLYGPSSGTSSYNVWLPDKGGIIALTTDIPDVSGKIDTAGTGLSKSGTTLNHSNSVTAQTTQAVYPIKIDAQGHISAYGSAVTIPTNTDEKVSTTIDAVNDTVYYPIFGTDSTTASTKKIDTSGFKYSTYNGTASVLGTSILYIGNNISQGYANNKRGSIYLYSASGYKHTIYGGTNGCSNDRTITLPDKTGTVALTSDIVDEKIKLTFQSTSGTYPLIFGPTSITTNSTYQGYYNTGITVNPSTKTVTATTFVGALTGTASGNLTSSSTLDATKLSGTIPSSCYTNTTYGISGSLSNHAFTSTLTAGGSGTTSVLTLAAGTGITLTDDTTNKKITIACSVTNTDENLKWTASTSTNTYYPLVSTSTATTSTANTLNGISFYQYYNTAGGYRRLELGNTTANQSTGGAYGVIRLHGANATYYGDLVPGNPELGSSISGAGLSGNRIWKIPDKSGTIALTSDLSNYVQKPSENGTSGWILKTRGNNNTYWDAPNVYQFGIYEDIDNPGTYSYYGGDIEDYIRSAFESGQNLALQLDLLNSINELDTYMLTDYHAEWVNADGGGYVVLWFTGIFKTGVGQKKITVGVYLDYYQIEHEYGEIAVDIKTINDTIDTAMSSTSTNPVQNKVILAAINAAASAGSNGSAGMTIDGWKICWGTVSLNTNSASGSGTYVAPYYVSSSNISLSYSGVPYVWCQVQGGWTGSRYATPYDVTETGFKIRLYASHKNTTDTSIRWLSIGKA